MCGRLQNVEVNKTMDDFNLKDSLIKRICLQVKSTSNNEMMDTLSTEINMHVDTLSKSQKKKKKIKTKTNHKQRN